MFILVKISLFLIRLCPTKLLALLVQTTLSIKSYRKQVINNNYKSTIGKENSQAHFKLFYKNCIAYISRVTVETLKFNASKSTELTYLNISELEERCKNNNGLILMASHYGNWELACINLPNHTSIPCYGVYKPLKNKSLDKEMIKLRSRFGLNLIPMNSIARSISTHTNQNTPAIYILIADQNPRSISSVIWSNFLGIKTAFSNGLVKLSNKYTLGVAYMKIIPGDNFYNYEIEFEYPSLEDKEDLIQWYSNRLENQINKEPYYWLWSHKRWKRKFKA